MKITDTIRLVDRINLGLDQVHDGKPHNKREYLRLLMMLRFAIRDVLSLHNQTIDELRYYSRQKKLMESQGVHFLLVDAYIQEAMRKSELARELLAEFGEQAMVLLDLWQDAGASLEELCNLCNKPYRHFLNELSEDREDETFSGIMFVHTLDHRDTGTGWIDWEDDSPFTHAIREYMLKLMLHTPEGREVAHGALLEVFAELIESAIGIETDEFGDTTLYDVNGMILD